MHYEVNSMKSLFMRHICKELEYLKIIHIWLVEKADIPELQRLYPMPDVPPKEGDVIFIKRKE